MNVYISADIEGVTGLVNWKQCGAPLPEHPDFSFARRMMTHDVNAAVRGARAAGAERVLVKDSHGCSRNLLIDQLESGVELISGTSPHRLGMVTGVDGGFGCAMLVGYHGMAGTLDGVMEHTITGSVHRLWLNGVLSGEIALSAATAGNLGVPVVMVSSDDKGCAEARSFLPWVQTAETKTGLGRYVARLKHPSETGPLIEAAARAAVQGAASANPWTPALPVTARLEFDNTEYADHAALMPGWERTDAYTIEAEFGVWDTAQLSIRRAMEMGGVGWRANL